MDITDAKQKQSELETAILKLVTDFETETLTQVTSISIDRPTTGYFYSTSNAERKPIPPSRIETEVRL